MSPTVDMFNGTKPRKKARVMAHMDDCGADFVLFKCKVCEWESGWIPNDFTFSEIDRGIPCEQCNNTGGNIMTPSNDPKYGIKEGKICNIATGKPIPDDEPIMIFRAKDDLAAQVIAYYENLVATGEHKAAVASRIADFNKFKRDHPERVKSPDTVFPFPEVCK